MTSWACMGDTWVILGWYTWVIHGYMGMWITNLGIEQTQVVFFSQELPNNFKILSNFSHSLHPKGITCGKYSWYGVDGEKTSTFFERIRCAARCRNIYSTNIYPKKKNRLCGQINHCGQRSVCLIFRPNCHLGRHLGFKIRGPHHRLTYFLIHVVCFCLHQTIAVVESHNFHQNE